MLYKTLWNDQKVKNQTKADAMSIQEEKGTKERLYQVWDAMAKPIHAWPESHRPIEKLQRFGVQNLSDAECLAILLGAGTKEESAVDLAQKVIRHMQTKAQFFDARMEELMCIHGIGKTKAARIIAALQLSQRWLQEQLCDEVRLEDPRSVARYFASWIGTKSKEMFCVLYLNTKNVPMGMDIISVGTLTSTVVHPREVYRSAVRINAHAILIAHNHPSGDPSPSQQDLETTERLRQAGNTLGVPLLDHLIIGRGQYYSLREE